MLNKDAASIYILSYHTGQIRPYNRLKVGGLWTILEGGKLWKYSRSKQKTEICWADFE